MGSSGWVSALLDEKVTDLHTRVSVNPACYIFRYPGRWWSVCGGTVTIVFYETVQLDQIEQLWYDDCSFCWWRSWTLFCLVTNDLFLPDRERKKLKFLPDRNFYFHLATKNRRKWKAGMGAWYDSFSWHSHRRKIADVRSGVVHWVMSSLVTWDRE